MEQNNFEKNVQQQLDEFKIPPSDSVWQNVEKRIGKKHKRRKLILLFLFLMVIFLSGAYYLFNPGESNNSQHHQIGQLKKDNKPTYRSGRQANNEDSSFVKSGITTGNNWGNIDSGSVLKRNTQKFKVDTFNRSTTRSEKHQRKSIDYFTSEPNKNYSKPGNKEDPEIGLDKANELIEIKPGLSEIDNANQMVVRNIIQKSIRLEDFSNQLAAEKKSQELFENNDSLITNSFKKQHKNPWDFGITFSGGTSVIGNNILEKHFPLLDLNSGGPQGGNSNGGNPGYYYRPSPIKNSGAFMAGIFIKKNLSPKTKISLGISYKYYSVVNKVGKKIILPLPASQYSSLTSFYNSVNPVHSYRSNFHYLEVPATIKIQLNKNTNLPLFWNGGINISRLLGTNALQFTPVNGYYYKDNSIFNKTQFGLNTGISATFFTKGKRPFDVGPYFYYGTTKLANSGLYNKTHFAFIGIKTEISFQKK